MALTATVQAYQGRPMLWINGRPTMEWWAYGAPNATKDFQAAGIRICQCHVPGTSWWTGPWQYDFSRIEAQIDAFLEAGPDTLIMPRVCFGYEGEAWWAEAHPDDLSVGRHPDGHALSYRDIRAHPIECWYSAASTTWTRDACIALGALVEHLDKRNSENILGYQIGAGISCEWFRWWAYVDDAYEDYSPVALAAFREFLKQRYGTDAALRAAWGRADVSFTTAEVPHPGRLHRPENGFLRALPGERDIIDWFDALSTWNADQLTALCGAVKQACGRRKLAGGFYGYAWPHWNNQSSARAGHMALKRVLACPDVDYISSPYHYDNRNVAGIHTMQALAQTIVRGGKLHLDEIDTATHRVKPPREWPFGTQPLPTAEQTQDYLRRDGAAALANAGNAWWMDLHHSGWYHDAGLQQVLAEMSTLAATMRDEPAVSAADVALVVDDRSPAYVDTRSNLNLYFTSLPRQFLWRQMGLPMDEMLLSEIDCVRPYRVYVFLNCWNVDPELRPRVEACVRRPGTTSVWFHAAGYFDGSAGSAENVSAMTGIRVVERRQPVVPEIELATAGHAWLEGGVDRPAEAVRFGARLSAEQIQLVIGNNQRPWDTVMSPTFAVDDAAASVLGQYVHDGQPGLAVTDGADWRTVYCGAPMLPGWLLRRIALSAGAHAWGPPGTVINQCGSLVSVYAPHGGDIQVSAPAGSRLALIEPTGADRSWHAVTEIDERLTLPYTPGQTRFFRRSPS